MDTEEVAEDRLAVSSAAEEFVEQELADITRCADRFIASVAGAMAPLTPGALDQLPGLRSASRRLQEDWLGDASPSALSALSAAALQDDSAPLDATKAEALLRARGRAADLAEEEPEPPIAPEAIGSLARDYGDDADGAVEAWLIYFAGEGQLWSVLGPSWGRALSPCMRKAFAEYVKGISKEEHQSLAEAAIDRSLSEGPPPADSWEAIAFRGLSGGWLVRALGSRRPSDGDLERWRALLEIARQRTLGPRAKPLVASELLRPLIEGGTDEAVELALDNLGLTGRRAAEEMLKEVQLGAAQQAMAEKKLKDMGWRKNVLSGIFHALTGGEDDGDDGEEEEDSSD